MKNRVDEALSSLNSILQMLHVTFTSERQNLEVQQ